jgi:hypothetical protein
MEILQVAENEKFLNTLGKLHTWNAYKTKNIYIIPLHLFPAPYIFYSTSHTRASALYCGFIRKYPHVS